MMPITITLTEFGRRLCATEHPHLGTTGARVPCGKHTAMASRLWALVRPNGRALLQVIEQVRAESGSDGEEVTIRE
jgi:hypothetical protein